MGEKMQYNKKLFPVIGLISCLLIIPLTILADNVWYTLTVATNNFCYSGGTNNCVFTGEVVNTSSSQLIGKPVNYATIYIGKNGSPSGTMIVGVWSTLSAPTSSNYLFKISSNSTSILTSSSAQAYTFVNRTASYSLGLNQTVGLYFSTGSASNNIFTQRDQTGSGPNTSPVDGRNSCFNRYQAGSPIGWGTTNTCENSDMTMIIGFTTSTNPSSGNGITNGVCTGLLKDCIGQAGGGLSGFVPNGYNFTTAGTQIGQGLGIVDPNNDDPENNGVGLFYMLATGTLFAGITFTTIATVNRRFGANISYSEVPKEYWLFLVIGVISIAYYLHWIPNYVFFGLLVGLAGLFAFGLYRHFAKGE
jgi:hypothetical protein